MPFYSYHCDRCDKVQDAYRHVSERHNGPTCCEQQMTMVIMPPQVMPDLPGYLSTVTGKWVEGRASRREDLRQSGCRPYEGKDAEMREYQRQQAYEEKKQDAKRYEIVAQTFYALPEAKRRQLVRG